VLPFYYILTITFKPTAATANTMSMITMFYEVLLLPLRPESTFSFWLYIYDSNFTGQII